MNGKKVVLTRIPVELDCPALPIDGDEVFNGAYEVPYFGHHLSILDIGANIGAFALWANMRWPHSHIHCYEPHPQTFEYLRNNVSALDNVVCTNAAIYPKTMRLLARGAGDSEAALEAHARRIFAKLDGHSMLDVRVIHPRGLPAGDVIKIDVEGAEHEILCNMDVQLASLIVLEFHHKDVRDRILGLLDPNFELIDERASEWSTLLNKRSGYRTDLAGDYYGTLCFANRNLQRMWRNSGKAFAAPIGLRELLRNLPGALARSGRALYRKVQAKIAR